MVTRRSLSGGRLSGVPRASLDGARVWAVASLGVSPAASLDPRWESRAALGQVLYATGDDDGAAEAYREAAGIIGAMGATLSPEHEKTFRAAPAVQEVLKAAT